MLGKILSFISKPVTQYLKNRGEIKKAEHTRDIAIIDNQSRLAADKQNNNHSWEMASLQDKDKWLRWFSFFLFTTPILLVVVSPEQGQLVFERLKEVPDWMLTIWFSMISGVWGISALKDAIPQLIHGFRK